MVPVTATVVITCYAEGELLREAVQSAWRQSVPPNEVIVVYDASGDAATIAVCQRIETEQSGRVIWRETNGGTAAARNTGFRAAQGEIIIPLDGDDMLPETAVAKIVETFTAYPDAGFIYGAYRKLFTPKANAGKENLRTREEIVTIAEIGRISLSEMLCEREFSLGSRWHLHTPPLRRSLWAEVQGYDESFGNDDLHDVEFWIRAIATGCRSYPVLRDDAVPDSDVIYTWRKYLGRNSRKVSPVAWARIAAKHYEIYRDVGLSYRGLQLLLLGSKWEGNSVSTREYSQQLWRRFRRDVRRGIWRWSSLVVLLMPVDLLRGLGQRLQARR
jgi:glycosyltransferase involved in cell wall biosynthesis